MEISKEKVKLIFQRMGLLPIVKSVYLFFFNLYKIKQFFTSLNLYLFNDLITHFPFYRIRVFYLRNILNIQVGKSSFIHMGARLEGKITIGNNTVIGRNCILKGDADIIIKNNVSITAETYIFTSSHMVNDSAFNCFYKSVIIEDYAWIGARAMILPGIRMGRGSVLGALSVATKDIPDYSIFVGTPAKKIGMRSSDLNYVLNYSPYFR